MDELFVALARASISSLSLASIDLSAHPTGWRASLTAMRLSEGSREESPGKSRCRMPSSFAGSSSRGVGSF